MAEHGVWLDVKNRRVTWLEDPSLADKARSLTIYLGEFGEAPVLVDDIKGMVYGTKT